MQKTLISFFLFTVTYSSSLLAQELHLQDAIQRGLHHSFGLQKAAIEINIADANAYQAYLLPNPQFSLNAETSSFMHNHDDDPSIAYGIGQLLETRQKRRSRREVAAAQQATAEANFVQSKTEVILAIKEAFIKAAISKHYVEIAEENKTLQEKMVQASHEKAELGKLSVAEKVKADGCYKLFDIEYRKKVHAYENAKLELAFLIGLNDAEFDPYFNLFEDVEFPYYHFCEEENNLIKIKNWEIEEANQQIALEEAKKIPDVVVNAGLFHEEDKVQPSGLFFGISFALPIFDNNDASISKAYLAAEKRELEKKEFVRKLHLEVRKKQLALEQTYEEILCYKDCILAKAEEGYQDILDCYEAGKIDINETFRAKQTCLDYQEKYLEVFLRYYALLIEFQKLTGRPLES